MEFTLVLPILVVLIVSAGELGLVFGKMNSLGYASREGARLGAALVRGVGCSVSNSDKDPSFVDATLIGAVQRILTSPDSGINLGKVEEIRIFKATTAGGETTNKVNTWTPGVGPDIDPGDGTIKVSFALPKPYPWPACDRKNSGLPSEIESIGVTVKYTYDFVTPLPVLLNAISGGALHLSLAQTTVMALNPT